MGSFDAKAIVPILGGLILILGGFGALFVDRAILLKNPKAPRPIFLRYTSQATYDLKQAPHWVFLTSTVIFAPFLLVTAAWQKVVADQIGSSVGSDIQFFAILCGASGLGVAASPMGNLAGTIVHTIFAGGFAAFGINYCVRSSTLASDLGDDAVATLRTVCWIVSAVGSSVMIFGFYPAGVGTDRLQKHEDGIEEMTSSAILVARISEFILAIGQVSVGIMIGVCVITAVTEVDQVTTGSDSDALILGLVSAAVGCAIFAAACVLNDRFYLICQTKHDSDDAEEAVVQGVEENMGEGHTVDQQR